MDERDRAPDVAIPKGPQPARPCGRIGLDPRADRLDHDDVTEAGDHGFAPWPQLSRFGGHQP
jgi:hypothetical protein